MFALDRYVRPPRSLPWRPIRRGRRLRVDAIRQDGPSDCTNACLRMLLRFLGDEVDAAAIATALPRDKDGCAFNTDVARLARRRGFAAACYGYNLYLNDPSDGALAQDELRAKLGARRDDLGDPWYAPMLDSIVRALDDGVRYLVRRPTFGTIRAHLDLGVPVVAVVSHAALHSVRGNPFAGHDVVITGYEGRRVFLIDPLDGLERAVDREHLMFSIASRSAIGTSEWLLALSRP